MEAEEEEREKQVIEQEAQENLEEDLNKEGHTTFDEQDEAVHDLSETYYSDRLVVLNNGEIVIDGNPLGVMEYDRILNKLGIKLPFEIELSLKLKLYGLIDKLYYDTEMLVNDLWQ